MHRPLFLLLISMFTATFFPISVSNGLPGRIATGSVEINSFRGIDMSFPRLISVMRSVSYLASMAVVAVGVASAQSAVSPSAPSGNSSSDSGYSSSNRLELASLSSPAGLAALPSAPSAASSAAGAQEGGGSGWRHTIADKYALEFGGGFNAPAGDKAYITWGGNFTVGGGLNFSKRLALLAEYQFIDDKLPGAIINEAGASGGNAHIWSLTLDPVISLFPSFTHDVYVTGGGGFYRKVTNFTDPEETEYCDYFCEIGTTNAVVGHFSSNQGGFNIGVGYQYRMGGMYHDSKTKLFAEVRYLDVLTPAVVGATPNGLGATTVGADTKLIPITLGVRW